MRPNGRHSITDGERRQKSGPRGGGLAHARQPHGGRLARRPPFPTGRIVIGSGAGVNRGQVSLDSGRGAQVEMVDENLGDAGRNERRKRGPESDLFHTQ